MDDLQTSTPFRPADLDAASATTFACPLCGGRFTHGTLVCTSCPMNAGCEIVKCPSCGYQFPRRSRIASWVTSLFLGERGS